MSGSELPSPEPRVAVILTCYNEGPYIGAAIRSVLDQSRADLIDSIVIADDGSAAETVAILKELESWDARIRVIYGTGGAGSSEQRNLAIGLTRAPIIAILDGDDQWVPQKLERQLIAFSDPAIGLAYSGYFAFSADDLGTAHRAAVLDITREPNLSRAYFLNDPPVITSTVLVRRDAFDKSGGFDPAVRVFEDTDLFLRLARHCRFALVAEPLLYKRNRATSVTGGRKDLMAHHALVAFKAAADDPTLLPLVPRRLAERARKLGNQRFLAGRREEAAQLLRCAVRMDTANLRAWASLITVTCFAGIFNRVFATQLRSRRLALGVIKK